MGQGLPIKFRPNGLHFAVLISEKVISYDCNINQCQIFTKLTLSLPIPLRLYNLAYWSNPPFLISDIQALWHSVLSARVPECQKLKMVG